MLEVRNLKKTFGSLTAVNDLSFTINDGEILGMIGQNGAGKTTTFRLILQFLTADTGEILWNGKPLKKVDYDMIGYLPEERGLYPNISIEEQIYYFARLRGKSKKEIRPQIDYWMEKFQVKGKKTDKVKSLSKGNQQKVQLICTLIHKPKLVILDEPFSGLDPVNADLLQQGIIELKEQGSCVIFSSHQMENVAEICDSLIMLRNGETVLHGKVNEIRETFGRTKLFLESHLTTAELENLPGVLNVAYSTEGVAVIHLSDAHYGKEIFDIVTKNGYIPTFSQQAPTLEEIFKLKAGGNDENK
ncbi:ABC transporter ATP-binding protein [Carnobacterium divergens]|uniref:ABC transporter, ATP-binding protein n=2 Tax=Carnobacterium divergens TaxID=2748 RepID=A0A0R2HQL0_CARDV|nr:ABC transporter ATP-binding protein [Carnobacterium divergens]KRN54795.1 ABC transporter, ATP-binding protein [Carnobacterium divergens DSM 20623]MDO0874283.1 ABC transporter ATP-binding protein [Carnobacterium divergens]MDT1959188.1 ABC transporter ATP-binding protein [Carnobacterium divergens]MDT1975076.1 ABC transporter ATP-binding protein [Carnobacterium divergens]MDT2011432.1 ABC transporter ATP-binding protein [Carnobacterium divergens]